MHVVAEERYVHTVHDQFSAGTTSRTRPLVRDVEFGFPTSCTRLPRARPLDAEASGQNAGSENAFHLCALAAYW
jgi:hypothetical protein